MTLEEFAKAHQLPARWLSLRLECEALVSNPRYWYCPELQNAAQILTSEASDILHAKTEMFYAATNKQRISSEDSGENAAHEGRQIARLPTLKVS